MGRGVINRYNGGAISQVWGGHQSSMGGGSSAKYGGAISQVWEGHQPSMGGVIQPTMGGAISQVWGGGIYFPYQYVQELKIQRITLATAYVLPSVK